MRWRSMPAPKPPTKIIIFCRKCTAPSSAPIMWIIARAYVMPVRWLHLQQATGSSAMSNTASQVIQNDVFIVTGSNTSENHPIISLQMKEAVMKYGAKMIVIDPRRIELVDFAEMWLPLKPGTNVPVFSAMAHVIVKENWSITNLLITAPKVIQEFVEIARKIHARIRRRNFRRARRRYFAKRRGCMPPQRKPQSIGAWASRSFRMARPPRWR